MISGNGMVSLDQQEGATLVHYAGDVEFTGDTADRSPRMVRTIANSLIRQFFESIDRQVQNQTGVHTTRLPSAMLRSRPSGTVDMEDVVAEIKQDRRTLWIVLALLAFVFFSFTGVVMVLLLLVRWGKRIFDRRVSAAVLKQQQNNESTDLPRCC